LPRAGSQEVLATGDWAPRVDIAETEKEFSIKAEIPAVKKEDVKVTIDNGVLTIKGERKQEKEEKDKKFHRVERLYGSFTRSFTLPDNVDESKIEASFKDGVLNLSLAKTEETKPKAIDVKIK
jgi:HSP20 family protein